MLVIQHLSCLRNDRLLFSDLNVTVNPGEILHVQGENGAGKSSLLQILAGLLLPEGGGVRWQDSPIDVDITQPIVPSQPVIPAKAGIPSTVGEQLLSNTVIPAKAGIQQDNISLVSSNTMSAHLTTAQFFYLGHKSGVRSGLTVAENLAFSASLMGEGKTPDLSYFKLTPLLNLPAHLLSAGQKQRVALTRLLITDATLWILDEPFNAIDQENAQALTELFRQHLLKGGMIIFTSHQPLHLSGVVQKQLLLSGREAL